MKKRKLFEIKKLVYYLINKGDNFREKVMVLKADLTMDDIVSGNWKNKENFKGMNRSAKGKEMNNGGLHPLMKMRSKFRETLLEMGFSEMTTNRFVESSFWNFDSLF